MLHTVDLTRIRHVPSAGWGQARGVVEARYSYAQGDHELLLLMRQVGERQAVVLRDIQAEFALVIDDPLILLCSRWGEALPWSVAPFRWDLGPAESLDPPPLAGAANEARIALAILLAEASTGAIRVTGCLTLPLEFTRALNEAIRQQVRRNPSPSAQERALAVWHRRYPTAAAVADRAHCRAIGCH